MKLATYLSAAIQAEKYKAAIDSRWGENRRGHDIVTSGDADAIAWRWYDRISRTAQRRLLAVSEAALRPLVEAASDGVVSGLGAQDECPVLHSWGSTDRYIFLGDVRRARRALGMES